MPLDHAAPDDIADFIHRKQQQWERVATTLPRLQMIQSGERATQFVIVGPNGECVIYGQWPHIVLKTTGTGPHRRTEPVPNERKPVERRGIDLSDDDLDIVIATWRANGSAKDLGFVTLI